MEGLADYYSTFFREYDPVIGRFNGVDPMSESFENWTTYHYSYNNPVNFNDPLGDAAYAPQNGSMRDLVERVMESNGWGGGWLDENGGGGGSRFSNAGELFDYINTMGTNSVNTSFGGISANAWGVQDMSVSEVSSMWRYLGELGVSPGSVERNSKPRNVRIIFIGGADLAGESEISSTIKEIGNMVTDGAFDKKYVNWLYLGESISGILDAGSINALASEIKQDYISGQGIIIYGYSRGGVAALDLSNELQKSNIPVALLLTIDAANGPFNVNRSVPNNVQLNVNYFQTIKSGIGSRGGANNGIRVENINLTGKYYYNSKTMQMSKIVHGSIDEATKLMSVYWINRVIRKY